MLEGVENGIHKLIAAYEKEKEENSSLKDELRTTKELNGIYRKKITELEQVIDNFRLTGCFLNASEDREEAGKKIAKMIKTIENCIGLLEQGNGAGTENNHTDSREGI